MGRFTAYDQNGRMLSDFDKSDYDFLCRYGRTPEEVMEENAKLRKENERLRQESQSIGVAAYDFGYRNGSVHYELEHCPACKNVADLQEALEENAKLREELAKARDPQRIGGQADPSSFVYAIEQLREFRWQHATNDEDAIPYINNVAAAHERENAKLREELEQWHRLTAGIELPEYPITEFKPKDLERENAKLRVERDEWRRVAVSKQDSIDHMRDANAENAKLRKENDTLCHRIDELCAENERLRQENQSIGVAAYELGRKSMADENAKLREER